MLVSPRRSSASRVPFLIVIGAIMVVGLVGVLLLHMLAAQDSYRANHLQQRLAALTDAEQRLSSIVEADSAPAALRHRAEALGMVPATITNFHKLHDGRTVGQQAPVYPPPPTPTVTHSAKPATKPGAGKQSAASKQATKKSNAASKTGKATKSRKPGKPGKAPGSPSAKQTTSPTTASHPASKHHHHVAQP